MKRVLIVFLTVVLLLGCFASCKRKAKPDPIDNPTPDGDVPLPVADYTGETYTVLYRGDSTAYIDEWKADEATTSGTISSAIYKRNASVEDRYGITFDLKSGQVSGNFENDFLSKVNNSVLAGDDTYQLVAGYTYRLAANSTYGNFLNLLDMPTLDLSADWWDAEFIEAASYNNFCFIADGPLSLSGMYSSACMYFNKTMLDAYVPNGTNAVFALVEDGEWDLDELALYAKKCTPADSDGVRDENDIYGFASERNTSVDAFIYASGLSMTTRKSDGTIAIKAINSGNRIVDLLDKVLALFYDPNCTYRIGEVNTDMDLVVGMILNGKSVFNTGRLADASKLAAAEIEYGILPYPKFDHETQKNYYSYKVDYRTTFAIPNTVKKTEMVSTITEALAYYSNLYVKDALYNVVLKYRDARDEESSKCVDLILNGGCYDFSNIYAFAWGDEQSPAHLFRQCVKENIPNISKGYQSNKSRYEESLAIFLTNFSAEKSVTK